MSIIGEVVHRLVVKHAVFQHIGIALSCRQFWADGIQRCHWINRPHRVQRTDWRDRRHRCFSNPPCHVSSKVILLMRHVELWRFAWDLPMLNSLRSASSIF